MKLRYYAFAGVGLAVEIPEQQVDPKERSLAPFRVETVQDPHWFTFQKVETLDPPAGKFLARAPGIQIYGQEGETVRYLGSVETRWQDGYLRASHRGHVHMIQVRLDGPISTKTVLNALGIEHLVAQAGGFILHCSYIQWRGKAILFTAPSGTGKSTQAELWKVLRSAQIINGDRAAVRVTEQGIRAEGIPFAGSSSYCLNESMPIAAFVYLTQGAKNTLRPLRGYEAFARIWEGVSVNTWSAEDVEQVSAAVEQVSREVPIFHLSCTPEEEAVAILQHALESRNL